MGFCSPVGGGGGTGRSTTGCGAPGLAVWAAGNGLIQKSNVTDGGGHFKGPVVGHPLRRMWHENSEARRG